MLCPGGWMRGGIPGAGLSQTQPVGKSSESRFKAGSTGGVSLWCCGCHEGVCGHAGGFLRHSRGVAGFVDGAITLYDGSKRPGRKKASRVELLPEPGSESSVQDSPEPGAAAWWGEISWFPDHPGGPQFFWVLDPGISAPEFQPWNFSPGRARNLRESN